MSADPLSDVLKTVRMAGAAFFKISARDPWVAEQRSPEMVRPLILPGADRIISCHIVTEGSCFASLLDKDAEPVELKAGDVIVFTRGEAHRLSSAPGLRAAPKGPERSPGGNSLPYVLNCGEGGPALTKVICGFLACDFHPFNPLVDNLPRMLIGNRNRGREMPWLASLMRIAMSEAASGRAGARSVLGKIAELMFIEIIREYVENLPPEHEGLIAGLRDPMVGKALSLMHGCPACEWGLEKLARRVGTSRSEFAERFACLVGAPPMQYLAKWRMQVAAGLLKDNMNIAAVAAKVGYGSEASFSRAFKKIVGVPPSLWRRGLGDHRVPEAANQDSPAIGGSGSRDAILSA